MNLEYKKEWDDVFNEGSTFLFVNFLFALSIFIRYCVLESAVISQQLSIARVEGYRSFMGHLLYSILQSYKILSPLFVNKAEVNSDISGSFCDISVDGL